MFLQSIINFLKICVFKLRNYFCILRFIYCLVPLDFFTFFIRYSPDEKGKEVERDKAIDESKYTEIVPEFKNTYFEEVYNTLKKHFKLGRVRILLKEPRSTLSWHRDPEPRLHIPIITNKGCRMVIEDVCKHMPADGSATITNNTKYHNFFNGGEQNRIHLVACVLENPFN